MGAVGLMVTAQGVAAGLGAPFIVAWSRRVDRRRLLTALLGGLFADHVGVTSVVLFGIVLVALAVIVGAATGRLTTARAN
ncbi:hypothetical protein OG245_34855 [Streptomyces sp. NBC_01116]|uniref:hypothetical protein n=1 Tax=Streptomyces sp. NBC_01116 TaxID=2903752 RepID=UPI003250E606